MNDLMVAVLCYAGDVAQVQHQLPSYLHHDAPVLILSPVDAPARVDHPWVENRTAGLSGWKGPHVTYKFIEHLVILLEHRQDWFLIYEPDSVCLSPELPAQLFERPDVLWSLVLGEPNKPGYNYQAPWFCHRSVLEKLADTKKRAEGWIAAWGYEFPGGGEGQGNSEFMSDACRDLGIEGAALPDSVWTYAENSTSTLIDGARSGAIFIGGIKKTSTYDRLVEIYRQKQEDRDRLSASTVQG